MWASLKGPVKNTSLLCASLTDGAAMDWLEELQPIIPFYVSQKLAKSEGHIQNLKEAISYHHTVFSVYHLGSQYFSVCILPLPYQSISSFPLQSSSDFSCDLNSQL